MDANTIQIIESINWLEYQNNVIDALEVSINNYGNLDVPAEEKIYQISVWTDPSVQETAVNFETKCHANIQISIQQKMLESMEIPESFDLAAMLAFQGNPADFKYTLFYTLRHDELNSLSLVDFGEYENEQAVLRKIEQNLLNVVDKVKNSDILIKSQMEDEVWFGVNSAEDWYDHVQKISIR